MPEPHWIKRSILAVAGLGFVLTMACSVSAGPSRSPDSSGTGGQTDTNNAKSLAVPAQPPGAVPSSGAPAPALAPNNAESKAAAPAQQSAAAPAGQPGGESGSGQPQTNLIDRLIIYTANLRLTVEDVPKAVSAT